VKSSLRCLAVCTIVVFTSPTTTFSEPDTGRENNAAGAAASGSISRDMLVDAVNKFGFKLFHEIVARTPTDSNVCVSPLSAFCALAIAYEGAANETRDEIASCLGIQGHQKPPSAQHGPD